MNRLFTTPGTDLIDFERLFSTSRNDIFQNVLNSVRERNELSPEEIANIERIGRQNNTTAVFPTSITLTSGEELKSLYGSPFPDEVFHLKTVHTCDYCLEFFTSKDTLKLHLRRCIRMPPGAEIYKKGDISIFEVHGKRQKPFCHNLCLMARLFLESKTVFHDTEHFMFYVLTIATDEGNKFVGYFSREMYYPPGFSMMCLMVLPIYQGKGYGRLLIELSYAMAKTQGLTLGPETPLSEDGKRAHEQFWIWALCDFLKNRESTTAGCSIEEIAKNTGIKSDDLMEIMKKLKWIRLPVSKNLNKLKYEIDEKFVADTLKAEKDRIKRGRSCFDVNCFTWEPKKITPQMNGFDLHLKTDDQCETEAGSSTAARDADDEAVPKKTTRRNVQTIEKREVMPRKCKQPVKKIN
uniref:histone acetyltransferase n=1 Tax=Caenorhabditis tropicalis TaxID=1561998 RepID=A0A1I7U058_9PELO